MLDAALARAEQEGLSHLNFLELIFGEPAARNRQRAIERRIRDAKFHHDRNLADFDWTFNAQAINRTQIEQLATGEFVRRGENLVLVGQSGVGKHSWKSWGNVSVSWDTACGTRPRQIAGGVAEVAGRAETARLRPLLVAIRLVNH